MELNSTKKDIINHLIAEAQGRHWGSKTSKYLRAFSGKFLSDMAFTIYFLSERHPIMYVYDAMPGDKRSRREVFQGECEQKKRKLREICNFYEDLVKEGYLEMEYIGESGRPELPEGYEKKWRKYSGFYSEEMEGLRYVCLSRFEPTKKLYELWDQMRN
jgi:hypothetical protein